jgi:hypothetical protein
MLFSMGCASPMVTIMPAPPENAEKLGQVSGSATGFHGFLDPAWYVIPIGLNSRVERAYQDALSKAPGATALTGVTLQENWYWVGLGTIRTVTITGEAVR